ncbi:alkylhydroperoxidase AhpD family core domain protein [Mycobacterium xenopi 4042]|uniref:Alkylhydroperoxidase AhpD family core domain protein n=1 Tax=Mycobacterium xenopi 4042 TaxID=1299334 RepID=X8ARN1_MYCXE|nr:alkylhydroperoxidase AhpD family core domain protein [Mycobacterium xenopi 4042]
MSSAALTSGALDKKVKELIAVAIGVVAGCDGCIASHAQAAARAGASKEEAAEAIGVSIFMHGGQPPSTVLGHTTRSANSPTPPPLRRDRVNEHHVAAAIRGTLRRCESRPSPDDL